MNWRGVFPSTADEQACMVAAYALTGLLFVMAIAPHRVFAFVMGLLS